MAGRFKLALCEGRNLLRGKYSSSWKPAGFAIPMSMCGRAACGHLLILCHSFWVMKVWAVWRRLAQGLLIGVWANGLALLGFTTLARFAARLPEGDAALLAPLLCAGLTAYGALKRAEIKAGETVAIFGCGGLGLYGVQLAHRLSARVIAVDRDAAKVQLAVAFGAEASAPDSKAHVCINFAPTPATWPLMVKMIRPRGRIIAAAMVPEPVGLNQEWLTGTGVRITGTSVGTRAQMAELMALHARTPLHSEVTRITLHEATQALTALDQGLAKGRYCIVF